MRLYMNPVFQNTKVYLEGHGYVASRLIIRITRVTTWVIGYRGYRMVINLHT